MDDFRNSKFYPTFKKITEKSGMDEKDYQIEGIYWAIKNEQGILPYDVKGGIIADEMGLGKTFQVISVLACHFKRRTLVVLPPILIDQWISAFVKITGHKPFVYHSRYTSKLSSMTVESLSAYPVVVTSYGMIISGKKNKNTLHSIEWNRVIYDEAHHLKNRKTEIFKGALLINARIKWFITGTPIQNRIHDLYSLCDILGIPRSIYRDKANHAFLREHFVLRRSKKDVDICVPPVRMNHVLIPYKDKISEFVNDELHSMLPFYMKEKMEISTLSDDEEDDEYEEDQINEIHILNERQDRRTEDQLYFPESRLFTKIFENGANILPVFMRARQMCIYPPMFRKMIQNNGHLVDNAKDLMIYEKSLLSTFKLDTLINLITERKDNENKKIVFCFFKAEIDYIYHQLNMINIKTEYIDGRVSNKKKTDVLFDCPNVLLLQIQTSCEGLNLQAYSEVYFTSPHWNPAVENQAIGRCHRIGQTKPVEVFKLISVNPVKSIEQYIIDVQKSKKNIAKLITG